MTKPVDKITSFDFLGMFIPGSVVMAMIIVKLLIEKPAMLCCGCELSSVNTTLMTTIVLFLFFASAYVLGLVINWISDGIWRGFRNNDTFIELQAQKLLQRNPQYSIIRNEFNVTHKESGCLCFWICDIVLSYFRLLFSCVELIVKPMKKYTDAEKRYYNAYYWLLEYKRISVVSVLESQVVFLRNMLLTIIVFNLLFSGEFFMIISIMAFLVMFLAMVARQNRVYTLILEDYQNFKEMEVGNEANSNNNN